MLDRIMRPNQRIITQPAGTIRRAAGQRNGRRGFLNNLAALRARLLDGGSDGAFTRTVNGTARVIDQLRTGTPRQVQPGRAYSFASGDYVNISGLASLFVGNGYSVCVWTNVTAISGVFFGLGSGSYDFLAGRSGDSMRTQISGRSNFIGGTLPTGEWAHLAWTFDEQTINHYVNGVLVGSTSDPAFVDTLTANTASHNVGSWTTGTQSWAGDTFDARVYNRALTADEVARIAGMGLDSTDIGPVDESLVLHLKCDEGAGTIAYDSSGNGNHGTITAAALSTFHDETTNDVYSFQNEVGVNDDFLVVNETFSGTARNNATNERPAGTAYTVEGFFASTDTDAAYIMDTYTSNRRVFAWVAASTTSQLGYFDGAVWHAAGASTTPNDGAEHHVAWVVDGTTLKIYVDGVQVGSDITVASGGTGTMLALGGTAASESTYDGSMRHVRYWGRALSEGEVVAASNGEHISQAENIPLRYPRDESTPAQDVLGNALTYSGQAPRDAVLSSPCGTAQNTEYVESEHLDGSETVVSHGGTATPTVSAGRITFTAGTVFDLVLSNGDTYPVCEGDGTTLHDPVNGRTLDMSNGVAATATWWAATQNDSDTLTTHGYRRSGSVNIPALRDGSGLAADGNQLTHRPGYLAPGQSLDLSGGEANSPYAQQLDAIVSDLTYDQADDDEAAAIFARTNADGDDRILVTTPALSGDDLTRMNAYTE